MTDLLPPVQFGDLRRLSPVDSGFGLGRGKPVDRHYIEDFLRRHSADIRGAVLEVGGDAYTREFGGDRVTSSDILHADASNPRATLIADLADADEIASDSFDCFICTQTLTYVYDVAGAVATIHRILRPGGVLLVTVPGISQMSPYDRDRWGEYCASRRSRWRACSAKRSRAAGSRSRRMATCSRRPPSFRACASAI